MRSVLKTNARPPALLLGLATVLLATTAGRAEAAEGMYLLDRLPEARLKKAGLKIPVARLRELSRAVVQVARGGSGAFVSDRGLLVTNHHVAYRCLARLDSSKAHQGIMARGYLAKTLADELPCPGYDLRVVERVEDVTAELLRGVAPATRRSYARRYEQLRLRKEQLRRRCEASGRFVCRVAANDGGTSYYLSVYRRVRDVRLVFAPPRALGQFGGDTDNWMYPRHAADFTFLRAYAGKDGKGGAYAKEAKPLKTPVHLKVSRHGVRRGSLALVIGFPGRTSRHVTARAARFHRDHDVPASAEALAELRAVLEARIKASADARRKYAGLHAGLLNAIKYYRMMREGFARWKVIERKLAEQQQLIAAIADPRTKKRAQGLLGEIDKIHAGYEKLLRKATAISHLRRLLASFRVAFDIARWSIEKKKPDELRKEDRYQDKNVYRFREAADRLERETERDTERALALALVRRAEALPRRARLKSVGRMLRTARARVARLRREARDLGLSYADHYELATGAKPSADRLTTAVDTMYGLSRLLARRASKAEVERSVAWRRRALSMSRRQLARLDDPLLRFARDLEAEERALREGPLRPYRQYLATVLRPRWVKRVKQASYPDANSTVRLTFGSVRDYTSSRTKVRHRYLTGLTGLMAKDQSRDPFRVPAALKRVFGLRLSSPYVDRQIKDIPINFTSTLDTTGGNSGSPVLDDRGRLIGLLFDGTPESVLSDWQYLPDEQRSICVDIRFAAYLAAERKARRLLEELGLL